MARRLEYTWDYEIDATPEEFWPYFADTNRFNFDRGNAALEIRNDAQNPVINARRLLRLPATITVEYTEDPYDWVRPFYWSVDRRFEKGIFKRLFVRSDLIPLPGGRCLARYYTLAESSGLLGDLILPTILEKNTRARYDEALARYQQMAAQKLPGYHAPMLSGEPHPFSPEEEARIAAAQRILLDAGCLPAAVERLLEMLRYGDELSLSQMKAYVLADFWGLPRKRVLEACLWGTRAGLLEFRWELLCPMCRNSRDQAVSLGALPGSVHCDTCHIDFSADFERSVEITFRPNASIREVTSGVFCLAGPELTPHIAFQQLLQPRESREIRLPLDEGRYRLRALELRGARYFEVRAEGPMAADIEVSGEWPGGDSPLGPAPSIHLSNFTGREQLLVFERLTWADNAVMAADVTLNQTFRDLFSTEALRPREQIAVGSLAILFTDLRDSTALYTRIGDAPAFGLVMNHFDVLKAAIDAEGGAIVKTIGDAVMGAFRTPAAALRAILRANAQIAGVGDPEHLILKAGLHFGAAIAVTLNDRLDYFGSTVNLAARLQGLSVGGDVVISQAVYADPEVQRLLEENPGVIAQPGSAVKLKGFEEEQFDLWIVGGRLG